MKTYILDRAKRVFINALSGSAKKIAAESTGGFLSGLAVKAMAAAIFKVALVGALIGGAYVGKGYLDAFSAEKLLQKVAAKLKIAQDKDKLLTQERQDAATKSFSGYYVVKIKDRNIYSIRSADHFYPNGNVRIPIAYAGFRHGGISGDAAPLRVIGQKYENRQEATLALAKIIGTKMYSKPPLAGGFTAASGGSRVTIDDWGAVDFSVLQRTP